VIPLDSRDVHPWQLAAASRFPCVCLLRVCAAKIIFDRVTGRSRGFGFISFSSQDDAQTALAGMDGKVSEVKVN